MLSLELVADVRAELGEGPVWDERLSRLYFVDILGHTVHWIDGRDGRLSSLDVGGMVSALALKDDQHILIALGKEIQQLNVETGERTPVTSLKTDLEQIRFNDGKCDARGRWWIGTMDMTESQPIASLYMLSNSGPLRLSLGDVTISNGLAWSPDHQEMYYIDTPRRCVQTFEFYLEEGRLGPLKSSFEIPPAFGIPDGMTADSEGNIWIAHWDGGRVSKWHPGSGALLDVATVPATHVTSCTFGGPGHRDLYITTARVGLTDAERADQPGAGGVFRHRTDVPGLPSHRFLG
jgi:sugar lactone lactonase YvrE